MEIPSERKRLFNALGEIIPNVVRKHFAIDGGCIITSAVAIRVLAALGVDADALSVKARILNAAYVSGDGSLAWRVGIGWGGNRPNAWNGHLVVLAEHSALLDYAIGDASRPGRDIELDYIVYPATKAFRRGREPIVISNGLVYVEYMMVKDRNYTRSPLWCGAKHDQARNACVSEVLVSLAKARADSNES
jgi:hypothetical protein